MIQEAQAMRLAVVRRIFIAQLWLVAAFSLAAAVGYFGHVGSLVFALLFGSLGGSIALLRRVRGAKDTVVAELGADMTSTWMPLLYGGLMAGVGYLLFLSGILSGDGGSGLFTSNLFPNFTDPDPASDELIKRFVEIRPATMKDAGKLFVWCFVAGYSERFITGILKQLERRGEGAKED